MISRESSRCGIIKRIFLNFFVFPEFSIQNLRKIVSELNNRHNREVLLNDTDNGRDPSDSDIGWQLTNILTTKQMSEEIFVRLPVVGKASPISKLQFSDNSGTRFDGEYAGRNKLPQVNPDNSDPSLRKPFIAVLMDGVNQKVQRTDPQDFEVDMSRNEFCFAVCPAWISLPMMGLHLYTPTMLFSIASIIGRPLRLDYTISHWTRPTIARILVEMDVKIKHSNEVWIGSDYNGYIQKVCFENLPELRKEQVHKNLNIPRYVINTGSSKFIKVDKGVAGSMRIFKDTHSLSEQQLSSVRNSIEPIGDGLLSPDQDSGAEQVNQDVNDASGVAVLPVSGELVEAKSFEVVVEVSLMSLGYYQHAITMDSGLFQPEGFGTLTQTVQLHGHDVASQVSQPMAGQQKHLLHHHQQPTLEHSKPLDKSSKVVKVVQWVPPVATVSFCGDLSVIREESSAELLWQQQWKELNSLQLPM